MKKMILPLLALVVCFTACGPAAENREQMHKRAKVFQDSIANAIRTSMDEAAAPGPNQMAPPAVDTTGKAPTPPAK